MSSAIPGHGKYRAFAATRLSVSILCLLCSLVVHVTAATPKTDAELAQALIGLWELQPTVKGFSKRLITFNADGTSKAIRITNNRDSPRRTESEGRWRVTHGKLVRQVTSITPETDYIRTRLNISAQIESMGNGNVKLRYEKADMDEMHMINQLPSLPPLATKPATIYAPLPEYPLAARRRRWTGDGLFECDIRPDGTVTSVALIRSTGHNMLDQAGISALRRWRFKPGGSNVVRVPLRFTMGGVRHRMSGAVISD